MLRRAKIARPALQEIRIPSTPFREISHRRLEAQHISSTTFTQVGEAVQCLCAVQAQDYLGALWAVGLRLKASTEHDVERALAERVIVRTWPMRGTLHFVSAGDTRWMTELLSPRPVAAAATRLRSFGIDEAVLKRARWVLAKSLEKRHGLTRPEAYNILEGAGIAAGGQRGLHILWRLAQDCFLCFGPRRGKQHTFVLFDEWLPRAKSLGRDEALATLAHRYFAGHGPATVADFAWWSGLKVAEVRHAIQLASGSIDHVVVDDRSFWSAPAASSPRASRPGTHILPAFDEFVVGYADRSAQLDRSATKRVIAGGILSPLVVTDGKIVGTWKRRLDRGGLICSAALFEPQTRRTGEALSHAFQRYARFLGLKLALGSIRSKE